LLQDYIQISKNPCVIKDRNSRSFTYRQISTFFFAHEELTIASIAVRFSHRSLGTCSYNISDIYSTRIAILRIPRNFHFRNPTPLSNLKLHVKVSRSAKQLRSTDNLTTQNNYYQNIWEYISDRLRKRFSEWCMRETVPIRSLVKIWRWLFTYETGKISWPCCTNISWKKACSRNFKDDVLFQNVNKL